MRTDGAEGRARSSAPSRPVPDLAQVRAILRVTLRRATRGRLVAGRSGKPTGLIFLLVMYGALGIVLGLIAWSHPDVFTFSVLISSFTFLMAGLTMVAESSTLLFDPTDNDILGHRPIHPRTLLLARSLGLVALALLLGLAINLFPMFSGLVTRGARPWFPLAHLASLLLLVVFSASSMVFVYALLARLVSRRTFDNLASWSQVGVTVVLIVCYQLVPRLMDRVQVVRIDEAHPLLLALPPTWFAALSMVMMGTDLGSRTIALAALAVLVTPLLGWAALRYLAADYARQVAALGETAVTAREPAEMTVRAGHGRRLDALLRVWLRDPVERGAFRLAAAYLTRDRDMRMRIYPTLAMVLIFPVIAILDRRTGAHYGAIMSLVFAGTLSATAMMTLKMSPQFAAADLFRYAPIAGTAALFHGVRKATLFFLVAPCLLFAGAILWFGLPERHSLLMTLPALMTLPTLSLLDGLAGDYLPLSQPAVGGRQGAINVGVMVIGTLWVGIFIGLAFAADHYQLFWHLVAAEALLLPILHALLLRGIRVRKLRPEGE